MAEVPKQYTLRYPVPAFRIGNITPGSEGQAILRLEGADGDFNYPVPAAWVTHNKAEAGDYIVRATGGGEYHVKGQVFDAAYVEDTCQSASA